MAKFVSIDGLKPIKVFLSAYAEEPILVYKKDDIDRRTAADVAPVVHGHWIYDKDAECVYCSSCLQFNVNEYTNKFSIRSKFCSRCGARMDEEEQGFDP